jgi:hypothetical protein
MPPVPIGLAWGSVSVRGRGADWEGQFTMESLKYDEEDIQLRVLGAEKILPSRWFFYYEL